MGLLTRSRIDTPPGQELLEIISRGNYSQKLGYCQCFRLACHKLSVFEEFLTLAFATGNSGVKESRLNVPDIYVFQEQDHIRQFD